MNTESNVAVNYNNLQGATSAVSTNALLSEMTGVMTLQSNIHFQTKSDGDSLLGSFMTDQIVKEGLEVPEIENKERMITKNENALALGRELRRLADRFEKSTERQEVKKKASSCLNIDSYSEFEGIATSLFNQGGITHSRIIVLFFFCSDVAIRSIKECVQRFSRFVQWFFKFLADYVYEWVERNGGWFAVLLNKRSYKKYLLSTVAVCVIAVGLYKLVYKR